MPTPLVSLDDIRSHLPMRASVTTYDERIRLLILTATQQIETATEREFDQKTHTQFFGTPHTVSHDYDFAGTTNEHGMAQRVRPARYTLTGVNVDSASLNVYYDPEGDYPASSRVDAKDVYLDAEKGLLTVRAAMLRTVQGLKVVYDAGYAVADGTLSASIPADLKMACIAQTLFLYSRTDPMNIGRESEKKEGEGANRYNVRGGLTPEAQSLILRYRTIKVSLD